MMRKRTEISLIQFLSPSLRGIDAHASVSVGASGPLSAPLGDSQGEGEAGTALATWSSEMWLMV